MSTQFTVVAQSLPALRFGRRYRLRLRAVDLAGNSMKVGDPLAALLALLSGLPRDPDGFPYLRYEPVVAPTVVLRDTRSVTDPGSQLQRLVIRTFNDDPTKDTAAADTTAADRFIVPPSTSVEVGERLGMFDKNGKLDTSAAMYNLIGARDKAGSTRSDIDVAGKVQKFPLIDADTLDSLPYPARCSGPRRRAARPARICDRKSGDGSAGRRSRSTARISEARRCQSAPRLGRADEFRRRRRLAEDAAVPADARRRRRAAAVGSAAARADRVAAQGHAGDRPSEQLSAGRRSEADGCVAMAARTHRKSHRHQPRRAGGELAARQREDRAPAAARARRRALDADAAQAVDAWCMRSSSRSEGRSSRACRCSTSCTGRRTRGERSTK